MNPNSLLARLLGRLGIIHLGIDGGDSTGGATDRGDDFTPTEDEDDKPAPADAATEVDEDDEVARLAKEAAEKAKGTKGKDSRIPLARHEAILTKEREARAKVEAQLAAARGATRIADTNEALTKIEGEVLDLEGKYTKALIDGEPKEAARLMAEIRAKERQISATRTSFETQAAEARAYERARYDATVDRLEAAYPELNAEGPDFDEELSDLVMATMQGYLARGGMTRADALQKSVKAHIKPATKTQERAVDVTARPGADDVAKKLAEDRKAAAVKRNLGDAARTPADTSRVGQDNDKVGKVDAKAVMRMSQDEFAKLDDATLAKMRGDEFV